MRALGVSAYKKVKIPVDQYLEMTNKWGRALSDSESEPESIVDMTVYLASLGIGTEGMDLVEVHQMYQAVVESLGDSLVGVPPAGSSSELGFPAGEGMTPPCPRPPHHRYPLRRCRRRGMASLRARRTSPRRPWRRQVGAVRPHGGVPRRGLPPRLQGHGNAAEGGSRSYIPQHPAPLREEVLTSPAHVRFNLQGALRAMVGENQIAVTVHKWKSALTMPQHVPFYKVH